MKKITYIVVALLLLSSITAIVIGNEADDKQNTFIKSSLDGNVLISDNQENDNHPKITQNSLGDIIVVYEKSVDLFTQQVPFAYSDDDGATWNEALVYDSIDVSGTGYLQYPDIVYNVANDFLWFGAIDPYSDYPNVQAYLPGDIANIDDWQPNAWTGGDEPIYAAVECTDNFVLSVHTDTEYGFDQMFNLLYLLYPEYYEYPPVMGGSYYDGQSEHQSAPASEPEMSKNSNRIFLVCETETQISIKSTVNDEALLTNGEMQNGMDKYADIEQWPGEYIGDGSDPDVSGSGNKLAVVYVQNGNVKCSYSTCAAGTYDPGFNWQVSTVDTGASTPAVYMSGDNVYCAYVKGGNLYFKLSENGGATWGDAEQLNDGGATVVADKGSLDIGAGGIVFTDNRNGNNDIFFASFAAQPTPNVIIGTISGGIGVSAVIENIGDAAAENFEWSIVSDGTVFLGKEKSGTATLDPGDTMTIKTGLMLGFGDIDITVTADTATKQASAKLLLFFVTGL